MDRARRARECLLQLERSFNYGSRKESWLENRDHFIRIVNEFNDLENLSDLFEQLNILEYSVKNSKHNESWKQWQRILWTVMTDPGLNVSISVTRFIICLQFFENSLECDTLSYEWKTSIRKGWLEETRALVDANEQLVFHIGMVKSVNTVLRKYGYNSLEVYERTTDKVIKNIRDLADNLDQTTVNTGIASTAAGGVGIASGIVTGVGVVMAPFTLGSSLALAGVGAAMGVGSAFTSAVAHGINSKKGRKLLENLKSETNKVIAETIAMSYLLESLRDSCTELEETTEIREFHNEQEALNSIKKLTHLSLKDILLILPKVYVKEGTAGAGLIANMAFRGAGSAATKAVATAAGGVLAIGTIGIGLWEVFDGAGKIKKKSECAQKFREHADRLSTAKDGITAFVRAFTTLSEQAAL